MTMQYYGFETQNITVMEEDIKHILEQYFSASNQAEIVKQRLHYHFTKTDGTWDIPKDMPFMKEFLNEVKKLCDIATEKPILLSYFKYNMHKKLYMALVLYFDVVENIKKPTIEDISKLSMQKFKSGYGNGRVMCSRLQDFCKDNGISILP